MSAEIVTPYGDTGSRGMAFQILYGVCKQGLAAGRVAMVKASDGKASGLANR